MNAQAIHHADRHEGDRILCELPTFARDRITDALYAKHQRIGWTAEEVTAVMRELGKGPSAVVIP